MRLSQSRNIKRGKNFMALLAFNSDESAIKIYKLLPIQRLST